MIENRLLLIKDGDEGHEVLFLDGKEIASGCPFNEGTDRITFLIELSKKYGFPAEEFHKMISKEVSSKTLEKWQNTGSLPPLSDITFKDGYYLD